MPKYMCFEVSLEGVKPRIWRRFLLRAGATFYELHEAIQDACGWTYSHLFQFLGGQEPIAGMPDGDDGEGDPEAREIRLSTWFERPGNSCIYLYDFGDSWEHEVTLVGIETLPGRFERRLVGGERAFPREDSGGILGYQRFVKLLRTGKDPYGEEPVELLEWLDGWNPDAFDLPAAQRRFDR
jgi:hypothetical protein